MAMPLLALDFAVPGALWGLVAVGIPVVLHLLFRQKPVVVRFPALRLLLASCRQTARRFRLKQLLLLLLRMMVVAAFVAVLAGPRLVEHHPGPRGGRRVNAVVVLDTSYSMSHVGPDGSPRFHRAKALALQMLDILSADSRLALILCADEPDVAVGAFTFDRQAIAERIKRSRSGYRPTDCTAALREAQRLFRDEKVADARAIFLFTDLTANGWRPMKEEEEGSGAAVYVIDVGDDGGGNRSVALDRQSFGAADVGLPFAFEARVAFAEPGATAVVELHVDDQLRGERHVGPDGEARCRFQTTPSAPGYLAGRVALRGRDAITADDAAYFAVPCGARRSVLVVDGAAGGGGGPSDALFLTRALSPPVAGAVAAVRCDVVAPAGLDGDAVAGSAAAILLDVARLSAAQWALLAGHVAQGGGLIVFGGPQVDVASYNAHGRDPLDAKGGLLPCSLAGARPGAAFRFRQGSFDHPLLRPFERENPHLGEPVFTACLVATPAKDAARVVLSFDNGLPALVEKAYGQGRVLVFTGTAGPRWGDFPRVPHAYVPFAHEMVRHVTRREEQPPWVRVGEAVRVVSPDRGPLRSVRVQPPDVGSWLSVVLPRDGQGRFPNAVPLADTEQPGIYLVEIASEKSTTTQLVAVNVDTRESLPERFTEKELARLLPGTPVAVFRRLRELREPLEVGGTVTDLNRTLVPLLLLLLVMELVVANRMYGRTAPLAEVPTGAPPLPEE